MRPSTVAVVAARNEAQTLAETLGALRTVATVSEIVVADDGSRDATAEIARRHGARVLVCAPPSGRARGKGHALRAGLAHARERKPHTLLLADADLGASAAHLLGLLEALDGRHPVAVAAFPPAATGTGGGGGTGGGTGGFGLVKYLARREILRRSGYTASEPLSGQRALLLEALEALPGIAPGFGAEVGMTLDLLSAGIKPLEVPLGLSHRPTGRNLPGFVHRARQGLDIARALRGSRIPW